MIPLLLALALSADPAPAPPPQAQPAPPVQPAPPAAPARPAAGGLPHLPGEVMAFDVKLGFLKMGEARITVSPPDGGALPVSLETRTTGIAAIVSLRSGLVSYLDAESGLPRSSRLEGVEPNYRHVDTAVFDREANVATVREVGRFDNTYKIDVPPGALDFVALVFHLRTLPLEAGETGEFHVLAGRTVSRIKTAVVGREVVETPAGDFPAVKVRVPTGLTGKVSEKSPTYVWFSDDARRAVVRISADFSIGRANALLTRYTPGRAPEGAP